MKHLKDIMNLTTKKNGNVSKRMNQQHIHLQILHILILYLEVEQCLRILNS